MNRPTQDEAEDAIRTLLRWAGDDPSREGLLDTPKRVAKAYREWFAGYDDDPAEYLARTFEEIDGYDEMVLLRDVRFSSFCEHHMAAITGTAHIGYLPDKRVIGISKLVRVCESLSRRLQIQERLTSQIAHCVNDVLKPLGVGVVIEAQHHCMTTRGVLKPEVSMVTSCMLGGFRSDASTRREFLTLVGPRGS